MRGKSISIKSLGFLCHRSDRDDDGDDVNVGNVETGRKARRTTILGQDVETF